MGGFPPPARSAEASQSTVCIQYGASALSMQNIVRIFSDILHRKTRIDAHTRLSLRFTARSTCSLCMGYFVCARCSISRELSIKSCKLASCRHRLKVYIRESRRSVRSDFHSISPLISICVLSVRACSCHFHCPGLAWHW